MDVNDLSDYHIRLDRVVLSTEFLSSTRLLAATLRINPYMTLKDYFQRTSDSDIQVLVDKIDREDLVELILLSELLAMAEGCKSEDIDQVTDNLNLFVTLVLVESLYRKGLIDVVRDNMTFDKSYYDKPIARRKE